jgi:hypothetical protein
MVSFSETLPGGIRLTETATGERSEDKLLAFMAFIAFLIALLLLTKAARLW